MAIRRFDIPYNLYNETVESLEEIFIKEDLIDYRFLVKDRKSLIIDLINNKEKIEVKKIMPLFIRIKKQVLYDVSFVMLSTPKKIIIIGSVYLILNIVINNTSRQLNFGYFINLIFQLMKTKIKMRKTNIQKLK